MSKANPKKVLFSCTMNSIRSPMAAALVRMRYSGQIEADSCGVYEGYLDPFMVQAMEEWDVDMADHAPKGCEDLDIGQFDLVVALTREAEAQARKLVGDKQTTIAYWQTPNPTDQMFGPRDMRLLAYTDCRDLLDAKIAKRFGRSQKRS